MLALDHRTAPLPIYTARSTSPKANVSTARSCAKTASKTTITPIASSPPLKHDIHLEQRASILFPAEGFKEIVPHVRAVSATQLSDALKEQATTKLPEASSMFPWLHGVHIKNREQKNFFQLNREDGCPVPTEYRGITLVHATNDDVGPPGRLIGTLYPSDILAADAASCQAQIRVQSRFSTGSLYPGDQIKCDAEDNRTFAEVNPRFGVGLRNFHIQARKFAMLSDIVVYDANRGVEDTDAALLLASRIAEAQRLFREEHGGKFPEYNVFVVTDSFETFETRFPHLVAQKHDSSLTGNDVEFLESEREQMRLMSRASEICDNIFLGNSGDWTDDSTYYDNGDPAPEQFQIHIKCEDSARLPSIRNGHIQDSRNPDDVLEISFPSSGHFQHLTADQTKDLVDFCAWLYQQTHDPASDDVSTPGSVPHDTRLCSGPLQNSEDYLSDDMLSTDMSRNASQNSYLSNTSSTKGNLPTTRRVLITCKDGYTETSFLALAYIIYANCMYMEEAWLHLHRDKKRSFYVFDHDVPSIMAVFKALIAASPHSAAKRAETLKKNQWPWFHHYTSARRFKGNFPSRILPHLYLGNLEHANDITMLQKIGIERVLSVGERTNPMMGAAGEFRASPKARLLIDSIQDDGIDPLSNRIEECLQFIDEGVKLGQATLVHCRVGVSRSASICIADVIRRLNLSLEDAYLLVRARRLNVIIQPNLRFMYELLRWSQEERSRLQGLPEGQLVGRTMEWASLSTKIARLNKHYIQH